MKTFLEQLFKYCDGPGFSADSETPSATEDRTHPSAEDEVTDSA